MGWPPGSGFNSRPLSFRPIVTPLPSTFPRGKRLLMPTTATPKPSKNAAAAKAASNVTPKQGKKGPATATPAPKAGANKSSGAPPKISPAAARQEAINAAVVARIAAEQAGAPNTGAPPSDAILCDIPEHWIAGPYLFEDGEKMNPRTVFAPAELAALKVSLENDGQEDRIKLHLPAGSPPQPWTEESHPELRTVDGERRWTAMRGTGFVFQAEAKPYTDAAAIRAARVTGTLGESLIPLDRARAWNTEMQVTGMGLTEYAAHIGLTTSVVSNTRRLLRLTPRLQALVNAGQITDSAAWNFLLPFAPREEGGRSTSGLRPDLAATVLDEIADALEREIGDDPRQLPKSQVQEIAAAVAARLSQPVRSGTGSLTDERPSFTLEEHEQCGCGGPVYAYLKHSPAHERCFDAAWRKAANEVAIARNREAMEARLAGQRAEEAAALGAEETSRAAQQPEPAAPTSVGADLFEGSAAAQVAATPPAAAEKAIAGFRRCNQCGQPYSDARDACPRCPTGATEVAAPEPVPLAPYVPGQVLTAEEHRAHDPARTWEKLGTWQGVGVESVRAVDGAPHPEGLPSDSIRYVEIDGGVAVYCADTVALRLAREGGEMLAADAHDRAAREKAEALRAEIAAYTANLRAEKRGETPAALALYGQVGEHWLAFVCSMLRVQGEWDPKDSMAIRLAKLTALDRKELGVVLSCVAMLAEQGRYNDEPYDPHRQLEQRAAEIRAAACTSALRALLETSPPPALSADRTLALHVAAVDFARRHAAQGAASARFGRGDAGDFPARVAGLRAAMVAASHIEAAGGGSPELDEVMRCAGEWLDYTPAALLLLPPDERASHLLSILSTDFAALEDARRTDREADAAENLADTRNDVYQVLSAPALNAAPIPDALAETVRAAIADADALLADVAGKAATPFGGFAAMEDGAAPPDAEEKGPQAMLAGLVAKVRAAAVHALNEDIQPEARDAARAELLKAYADANAFFGLHEVAYSAGDEATMEEAEMILNTTGE